jgi:mRNA interferase MazF
MKEKILRGDLYYADLDPVVGSEQGGSRPVLIVQNKRGNKNSPTLIVLPITSREKPDLPSHVSLTGTEGLTDSPIVLAEQLRTIDKSRLVRHIGSVSEELLSAVDRALLSSLVLLECIGTGSGNIKTLSAICKEQFESAGYQLCRISKKQDVKSTCDFCNTRTGFDYEVSDQ